MSAALAARTRNPRLARMSARRLAWVAGLTVLGPLSVVRAQLVINELDYDQPATDGAEFVELMNRGDGAVELADYTLVLVNGANGGATPYGSYRLPAHRLPAGGYFVLCADAAAVPGCHFDLALDADLIQNGAPDALVLQLRGAPVDALSYEGDVPGTVEAAGAQADSGERAESLSRCPNAADSGDNGRDFRLRPSTPGAANDCAAGADELGACGEAHTPISAVQGGGDASPLLGQTVVIEGVVVADFQELPLNGFFMQSEDADRDQTAATSEGMFVYEGALAVAVAVGERVRVRGEVREFDQLTELSQVNELQVCPGARSAGASLLRLPVATLGELERYEGMLVELAGPLTVSGNYELGHYGVLDLSVGGRLFQPTQLAEPGAEALALQDLHERSRILLDDLSTAAYPAPVPYLDASGTRRAGDTLSTLTGVLSGQFGGYRIHPTVPPAFAPDNPRPTRPNLPGRLQVASFNVLNYFTTVDDGQTRCGPRADLECRGADSALERDRQREKLLTALAAIDADLLGLLEIENDASAAVQELAAGLNARAGAATYGFVDTGTIGSDAIKLALLYKPAKVAPEGAYAILDSRVDPQFLDAKHRPVLAQTFRDHAGARFTIVLNHWKSKGSSCEDVGDPDRGDGQGPCNRTRTQAAQALLRWLADDPTASHDPDFLVLGDLNAYAREDPLDVLKAGGLLSLLESLGPAAYSYQFQGQSGYLDHALATHSLASQVAGVAHWHIGADEPRALDYNLELKGDDRFRGDEPFASSDHDPLLVGLNLTSRVSGVQTSSGCRGGSFTFSLVLACGVPWRRAGAKRSRRGGAPA